MNFEDFIKPELLILIPVLYFIGIGIKKCKKISNKWIPICLGGISIVLSLLWVVATTDIANAKEVLLAVFISITQGVLIAGASVYSNQIAKQITKGDNTND